MENAPGSYIEDDDSDDDIGKPSLGLDTKKDDDDDDDSDDKDDNEATPDHKGSELIDIGGSKAALNIPKLNAPK